MHDFHIRFFMIDKFFADLSGQPALKKYDT